MFRNSLVERRERKIEKMQPSSHNIADKGLELHTVIILIAIKETRETLEWKIKTVAIDVYLPNEDHKKLVDRVADTESTLAHTRPTILFHSECLTHLEKEVKVLRERVEGAEGQSRCNNIRVVGIPEKVEGPSVELYMEGWLVDTMLEGKTSKWFTVEGPYRAPVEEPNWVHLL
ncbi:hypothetical protein NDU88_007156 [Pleurodeles waltl]|uniref:Uncharacterized protein n=1 Tax=Pleurodeles waltl TaxID=8319 RepID=A0AAV7N9E5_PLEWA|nr:hypothetical protein NDU88_007156 [Pleurodeles waltl]